MRYRVHHPLFVGFLGVTGLLVALIVALVGNSLGSELRRLYRAELTRELLLAADLIAARAGADPDSLVTEIAGRLGYRVTLIDSAGVVLGESGVSRAALPAVENHGDRPEVVSAWASGAGFSERQSATVGVELLYAATRAALDGRPVVLRVAAPLTEVVASVRRAQRAVAVAGLLAMLLSLAVAYFLARALSRPLEALAERAGALAAGDFSRRVPRNSRVTELDELAVGFNRLADELQIRLGELGRERDEMQALIDTMAEGVVALTQDARVLRINRAAREFLRAPDPVTFAPVGTLIRHTALRELLEESVGRPVPTREVELGGRHFIVTSRRLDRGGSVTTFLDVTEIRRLEQVRRDFVANVSHELKTPLTSIRGFTETLIDDEPPEPLRRQFLEKVRRNTLRLQRLVDDLLDLSRLEAGRWTLDPHPVDVAAAARDAWQSLEGAAAVKGVGFEAEGEALALADDQALAQIFENLFDNALRYTPSGGRVRVAIEGPGPSVRVAVADSGSGIPARSLPRIFERFYRADPARSREEGGTGLGLAIVRHLVQGMGGEVSAESELGQGTTVRFTLPPAR
jgi:two-component system, OmpR family, phosphate regulon sensor histidine kinase PhoR